MKRMDFMLMTLTVDSTNKCGSTFVSAGQIVESSQDRRESLYFCEKICNMVLDSGSSITDRWIS